TFALLLVVVPLSAPAGAPTPHREKVAAVVGHEAAASHRGPRDQTGKHPVRHGVGVGRRGVVEARLVKTDTADRAVIVQVDEPPDDEDRKSTRLNSSHVKISYAVFCLKKKRHNLYT